MFYLLPTLSLLPLLRIRLQFPRHLVPGLCPRVPLPWTPRIGHCQRDTVDARDRLPDLIFELFLFFCFWLFFFTFTLGGRLFLSVP